jgi:hypothetical protein
MFFEVLGGSLAVDKADLLARFGEISFDGTGRFVRWNRPISYGDSRISPLVRSGRSPVDRSGESPASDQVNITPRDQVDLPRQIGWISSR